MLTNEQIQYLFTFCEQHSVHYYDVQVELVDHLANAVEEEITMDPKIGFEKALEKVHGNFGVMGFAPLVSEKQKFAEKQSRRIFWKLFKKQFHWPKIILFFLLSVMFFTLFSDKFSLIKRVFLSVNYSSMIILIPLFILQRTIAKTGKKFLIINLSWISSGIIFIGIFYGLLNELVKKVFFEFISSTFAIPIVSILLSTYLIIFIAAWQTLTSVKKELYKTYPEIFSTKFS